jgi:hypothetical protein
MNAAFPSHYDRPLATQPYDARWVDTVPPPSAAPSTMRPPAGPLTVAEARATFEASPATPRKSRRWIVDLLMISVGALIGVYLGNARVRDASYALAGRIVPVAHASVLAPSAPTARATRVAVVTEAGRARMAEITRVAAAPPAADRDAAKAAAAPRARLVPLKPALARRAGCRITG